MVHERLERTSAVDEVLGALTGPVPPPPYIGRRTWRAARPFVLHEVRSPSIWMLPPVLRERFGLRWTRAHEMEMRALARASRAATPLVPGLAAHVRAHLHEDAPPGDHPRRRRVAARARARARRLTMAPQPARLLALAFDPRVEPPADPDQRARARRRHLPRRRIGRAQPDHGRRRPQGRGRAHDRLPPLRRQGEPDRGDGRPRGAALPGRPQRGRAARRRRRSSRWRTVSSRGCGSSAPTRSSTASPAPSPSPCWRRSTRTAAP